MNRQKYNKYLYGKKIFLSGLLENKNGLRFSHISYYSEMENEKMRDNEKHKIVNVDSEKIVIETIFNDEKTIIKPSNIIFSKETYSCYCLCLSNKKDNKELYEKFKADICIEFDTKILEDKIRHLITKKFEGFLLKSNNITYYKDGDISIILEKNSEDLVFYKPDSFSHEDEYRIALFYPLEKKGFKCDDGEKIPFPKHFYINATPDDFISESIIDIFYC